MRVLRALLLLACVAAAQTDNARIINAIWFQWAPCDALRESIAAEYNAGKDYDDSGRPIDGSGDEQRARVQVTCIPLADWNPTIRRDLLCAHSAQVGDAATLNAENCTAFSDAWHERLNSPALSDDERARLPSGYRLVFDLVIPDSQYVAEFGSRLWLTQLNDFIDSSIEREDFYEEAFSLYGEYPVGTGTYWGIAAMTDVKLLFYRRDVFRRLGVEVPASLSELADTAERIDAERLSVMVGKSRAEKDAAVAAGRENATIHGYAISTGHYDEQSTVYNELLWSFGGALWDELQYRVAGVLNTPAAYQAARLMRRLYAVTPESAQSVELSYDGSVAALCNGDTAMTHVWAGFASAFVDKASCEHADDIDATVVPGESRHFLSAGGMGAAVPRYTQRRDDVLAFFRFFFSRPGQLRWVDVGGLSGRRSVLATGRFLNAQPHHPEFVVSYPLIRDFWQLPEYTDMLALEQAAVHTIITADSDSIVESTIDELAASQQRLLHEHYPEGRPLGLYLVGTAESARIAVGFFAGLFTVAFLVCAIVVYVMAEIKEDETVVTNAPGFVITTLIGAALMVSSVFAYMHYTPTNADCIARHLLPFVAYVLVIAPLALKLYRVYKIWSNLKRYKVVNITVKHMLLLMVALLTPMIVLLAVWFGVDPPTRTATTDGLGKNEYTYNCRSTHYAEFMAALVAYAGIILVFSLALAIASRNVAKKYNDSRHVAFAVYQIAVATALLLIIEYAIAMHPTTRTVLYSTLLIAFTIVVVAIVMFPIIARRQQRLNSESLEGGSGSKLGATQSSPSASRGQGQTPQSSASSSSSL